MAHKKQSLLWQITPPQTSARPSYLFGTMHVQDEVAFRRIESIKSFIESCEAFATEYDLNESDPQAMAAEMQLPNGQSLQDIFTRKQFERVQKFLRNKHNLDINQFQYYKPIAIVNTLTMFIFQKDHQLSLDETLHQYAQSQRKIILGLETFDSQLEILRKIDLKTQSKQLLSIVRNFKKYRKSLLRLTELYQQEDIQKLYKSSKKSLGNLKRTMLYDRNLIMTHRMTQLMQRHTIFCAVGAGHLAGSKGILKLLKNQGYQLVAL